MSTIAIQAIQEAVREDVVVIDSIIDPPLAAQPELDRAAAPVVYASYSEFQNEVLAQARRSGWRGAGHVLRKRFTLKFNRVTVKGTAIVNFSNQTSRVWACFDDHHGPDRLNNVALGWENAGVVLHPHEVHFGSSEAPYLCHTLTIRRNELTHLRENGELCSWLVGVIEGA